VLSCLASLALCGNPTDPSTYANIDQVMSTHLRLIMNVRFEDKAIDGVAFHNMKALIDSPGYVLLDHIGMDIQKVAFSWGYNHWELLQWDTSTPNPNIGSQLNVTLGDMKKDDEFFVMVVYNTNAQSTAFSWMTKEQTACKTMEYLFTQCEDIACRSVAPMQDTPANRITYEARVTVPTGFIVKMSANETGVETSGNLTTFSFENKIAMPSYLIAMAIGDLEYRSLGDRTGVITEPCFLDAVATELVELPTFLDKAEAYLTPYIWGNYTILILPPSFPMGGMENPLLTFASPTIITGDKSQVDVAIHEIAHSWTGNEVTCENWSNFWLNEGFTVFEERKVSAELHDEDFSKVNAFIGNISATQDMLGYGLESNYSSLYPEIGTAFPDDSFSTVPYEKGFQLLYYMETELIGATNMQELLRTYILKFSLQSI
jgi:leukotriene-A4 hydrolase